MFLTFHTHTLTHKICQVFHMLMHWSYCSRALSHQDYGVKTESYKWWNVCSFAKTSPASLDRARCISFWTNWQENLSGAHYQEYYVHSVMSLEFVCEGHQFQLKIVFLLSADAILVLTHCVRVTPYDMKEHWLKYWLVACPAPSFYLNQWWIKILRPVWDS